MSQARRAFGVELDVEVEDVFGFAAADGEHAVRGDFADRLAVIVIHFELFLVVDCAIGFGTDDDAFFEHHAPEGFAELGIFGDGFGDDVARAFESFLGSGDRLFGIDERGGKLRERQRAGLLFPEVGGEGFEAFFAGHGGFGAAPGLVREVEVFELAFFEGGFDAGAKVVSKFALVGDGAEDGFAAVFELAVVGEFFFDGADLNFVEIAGDFFAVTGDEGDGAVFVEEFDGGDEAFHRDVEKSGDVEEDGGGEGFGFRAWGSVRG